MKNLVFFSLFFFVFSFAFCSDTAFFSQYGQDKFIYEHFFKGKKEGFFIDIGAHNGITGSNSYFFEKYLGWKGVCIEPIPEVFVELEKNRSCLCVNACAGNFNGTAQFLRVSGYSEMLSGLLDSYDPRHLKRIDREINQRGGAKEIIDVTCFRLQDFFDEHGITHVDYINIDTEGSEFEILQSVDFEKIYIDVLSVESNYGSSQVRKLLERNGYRFVQRVGSDEIYRKKKLKKAKHKEFFLKGEN